MNVSDDPTSRQAQRFMVALNDLGHLGLNHPMEYGRRLKGDAGLREAYL